MNMMKHKGFLGSIEMSPEDDCFFGKLEFINSLVNYEGQTAKELEDNFKAAVEDYLSDCQASGQAPEKPWSGTFNVRPGRELHKSAAICAAQAGINLNEFVAEAIREKVASGQKV